MLKKSILILLTSQTLLFCSDLESKYITVKPNENIKNVVEKLGKLKDITYEIKFDDFNLQNNKELRIKNINELLDYIEKTNGYRIIAENKNGSKYENRLPINLISSTVPKKVLTEEEKASNITSFNQLYIFINNNNISNSNKQKDLKKISLDRDDISLLKSKIIDIAKQNNKIDLLFLNEKLKNITTLEAVKHLVKELERI